MTQATHRPDLRRLGETAFTEVLDVLLSRPAIPRSPASQSPLSSAPDHINSRILLAGPQLSASVHVHLPQAFVAQAVQRLTGLDGSTQHVNALLDDTAGEIANLVAGRVAAQLTAHGYLCTLSTPTVSRGAKGPVETELGMDYERIDLCCDGYGLSLELHCRYSVP
jgi:CheY-specific phosphatase CheX